MSKRNGGFDPVVHDPASVDNVPLEVPLEFREPPRIEDEIRRFIRIEMSRHAEESGFESFEEANDLEFSDDEDFDGSANELTEDQEMAMMSVARSSRDNGDGNGNSDGAGRSGTSGERGVKRDGSVGDKGVGKVDDEGKSGESSVAGVQSGGGVSKKGAE